MSDGFPTDDPWATPPPAPPAPPPQQQAPATVTSGGGAQVDVADETSVTLKAHGGYNAPWIVVRSKDPERVAALLNRVGTSELHLLTARAHIAFMNAVNAAEGNAQPAPQAPVQQVPQAPQAAFQAPAQGGYQQAPQRQQGAPQGPRGGKPLPPGTNQEYCNHGAMTYREGNGNFGPWRGFTCTLPKNDPNACKAIYL